MEIVLVTIESGSKEKPSTTNGYKFNYIVSGSCEYTINNDRLQLEEGDSLYLDATHPHVPVNNRGEK